jgi:hypothetical protein
MIGFTKGFLVCALEIKFIGFGAMRHKEAVDFWGICFMRLGF